VKDDEEFALGQHKLLEARLKTLLPEEYREMYNDVQPVLMGSAGLKYDADGRVAWGAIWQSFCHLAMAGGPPHRGKLLESATAAEIAEQPERYDEVVTQVCRGVQMVSGLAAEPSTAPGWIDVDCPNRGMAGWLVRAINMENVSAHADALVLHLPAGPQFRVEKEIKNVVTSIAKTCHYWVGHTSVAQHRAVAQLFQVMEAESPLIQAPFPASEISMTELEQLRDGIAAKIQAQTGLKATGREYCGWLGIDYGSISSAVWSMRMMIACNVLARREGDLLYLPINPLTDEDGTVVVAQVVRVHRAACAQGVL
jgi:sirohydrochlorin cobaltochelatase